MMYNEPTKVGEWDLGSDWDTVDDILDWILSFKDTEGVTNRTHLGMYEVSDIDKREGCPTPIIELTNHVIKTYGPIDKTVGFLAIDDQCVGYPWHQDAWNLVVCNYLGGPTTWEFDKFPSIFLGNHELMYVPMVGEHRVIGTKSRFSMAFCLSRGK